MSRWGKGTSVWLDTTPRTHFQSLAEGLSVDVAVVGGGIAGLFCAYLLSRDGASVAVVEAGRVVEDVTGFTTGKITSQHSLIYGHLLAAFGAQKAQAYADASQAAIERIANIIEENRIDCDFRRTEAYVFTEEKENLELIQAEVEPARRLGLPASFTEETPLWFARGAIRFEGQAQWHPRRFLLFLAGEIALAGGYIFENTRALDIREGRKPVLVTEAGELAAKSVVVATNAPFFRRDSFKPLLVPTRSYVLGVRLSGEVPQGLFYTIDSSGASMRHQAVDDSVIFMVGGWDKSLKVYETDRQYEMVEEYAGDRFEMESIDYHWFTQDMKTPDRVPLIGRMPGSPDIYVATGFNGWGMTNSCVAAMVNADLIAGRHNPWAFLYNPERLLGNVT